MNGIRYISCDVNDLERVRGLWELLNLHHQEVCPEFERHFAAGTFDRRVEGLTAKSQGGGLRLDVAECLQTGEAVGYVISVIDQEGLGEVESLYVSRKHRGKGIAHELMTRTLEWLRNQGAREICAGVVSGNEKAWGFYARYGFAPRYTALILKKDKSI